MWEFETILPSHGAMCVRRRCLLLVVEFVLRKRGEHVTAAPATTTVGVAAEIQHNLDT